MPLLTPYLQNIDFFSATFWAAFTILILPYYCSSASWQNKLLVLFNYLFFLSWGPLSFVVQVTSLLVGYFAYQKIQNSPNSAKRIATIYVSFQVGLLFFLKFFARKTLQFPIGMSYYSLAQIAFLLETIWRRTEIKLNFEEYAISSSFFPIAMMGPIERFSRFSLQLKKRRHFQSENFQVGAYYVLLGFFKIVCIANVLSLIVNHEHEVASKAFGFGLLIYCFLSFIQLYTQFSGFIDIAQGVALFLGLKISKNFDQPYFANSIGDVWRRWHISLTTWLRDFIFLPVMLKTRNIYIASFVVFVAVGFWHGLTLDYFWWTLYWAIAFYISAKFKFRVKGLNTLGTLLVISYSTICFMIPYYDFGRLLSRLIIFTPASLWSFFDNSGQTPLKLILIFISVAAMVAIETQSTKHLNSFLLFKILLLIFMISLMGDLGRGRLLYLGF